MERYDSYKDSGVEWIGEVPSHWKGYRLRNLGGLYGGLTGKSGDDFKQDDHPMNRPYIPYTNIFRNTYISKEHVDYVVLEEGEKQNRVEQYDLFFLMSSENYDDLGKPCVLVDHVEELYLNSFCKGFRVRRNIVNPLFLNYQLLGDTHRKLVSIEGKGFTRINLRQDRLIDTPMVIPPLHEQEQIVGYLDRKTTLIDSLIEKTVRKIELLKEKRTSLINEVVTKGLNPDVEMKDSGVEWIGEIPSHWALIRLSFLMKKGGFRSGPFGSALITSELLDYGHVRVLSPEFVTHGEEKHPLYLPESREAEMGKYLVSVGDILIPIVGTVGKARIVKLDDPVGILNQRLCRITPDPEKVALDYIHGLLTQSNLIAIQYSLEKKGAILDHITKEILFRFRLPLPPLHEQEQIVEYLDEQTSIIDSTITTEEKRIELLKEYRQSLISEVVTGKVKVTRDE